MTKLKTLHESMDAGTYPEVNIKLVRPVLEDPRFQNESLKTKSLAAANIAMWCRHMVEYYDLKREDYEDIKNAVNKD